MKRDVSRDDTAPAFRERVERSAGADAAAFRSEILAFKRWIPSMREGQVAFTPGTGVVVRSTPKDEAFRGSVRFGTALFGMWVGRERRTQAPANRRYMGTAEPGHEARGRPRKRRRTGRLRRSDCARSRKRTDMVEDPTSAGGGTLLADIRDPGGE